MFGLQVPVAFSLFEKVEWQAGAENVMRPPVISKAELVFGSTFHAKHDPSDDDGDHVGPGERGEGHEGPARRGEFR